MIPLIGAISLGAKAIGGIVNLISGAKAAGMEREAIKRYLQKVAGIPAIQAEDFVTQYEELDPSQLQQYQAMQEQAILAPDTEVANIQLDPRFKDIRMAALEKMTRLGEEGLSVQDEAARNQLLRDVSTRQKGAQDAIIQSMQRRGQLGSGAELAARMASAQGDYEQAAMQGEALASERNRRALQAVLEGSKMAGDIESDDYNRALQAAQAKDITNRFNVGQKTNAQSANVGRLQAASDKNVGLYNTATTSNLDLRNKSREQRTQGRIAEKQDQANRIREQARGEMDIAGVNSRRVREIGSGIGQIASTVGDAALTYNYLEGLKKDSNKNSTDGDVALLYNYSNLKKV
jgi:hypothetical protein